MSKEYEITNGTETMVVGWKTIEGGILQRGFQLKDEKLEAELMASHPSLFPDDDESSEETVLTTEKVEQTNSSVPVKEPAKDVNEIVKDKEEPKAKPDFKHALTLNESDLDKYAATFGCELDGRRSLESLRATFAEFCGVEYTAPQEDADKNKTDVPADLVCPHCKTKARSEKSYKNNHGAKCYKALKVK